MLNPKVRCPPGWVIWVNTFSTADTSPPCCVASSAAIFLSLACPISIPTFQPYFTEPCEGFTEPLPAELVGSEVQNCELSTIQSARCSCCQRCLKSNPPRCAG